MLQINRILRHIFYRKKQIDIFILRITCWSYKKKLRKLPSLFAFNQNTRIFYFIFLRYFNLFCVFRALLSYNLFWFSRDARYLRSILQSYLNYWCRQVFTLWIAKEFHFLEPHNLWINVSKYVSGLQLNYNIKIICKWWI